MSSGCSSEWKNEYLMGALACVSDHYLSKRGSSLEHTGQEVFAKNGFIYKDVLETPLVRGVSVRLSRRG